MSRTIRASKKKNENGVELLSKRKMKPYSRRSGKFIADLGRGIGISKLGKLITKNANRSLKKSIRQLNKKLIKQEIKNRAEWTMRLD